MKVGDRLFLGSYSAGDCPEPISWLKATRDDKFLSEFVLDILTYDQSERRDGYGYRVFGNANYRQSNIFQYLNSEEEDWFRPSHRYDECPGTVTPPMYRSSSEVSYAHKPGFLCGFEPFEKLAIIGEINLPAIGNLVGLARFELFKRKGVRGKLSQDALEFKPGFGYDETTFVEYMTRDARNIDSVYFLGRNGQQKPVPAQYHGGVRPVCVLNGNEVVKKLEDGSGYVLVSTVTSPREVCSQEDICSLLGLL